MGIIKGRDNMSIRKIMIVLTCLMCFAIPSFASSWYWIGQSRGGTQYYIDNTSVRKNYDYAVVWVRDVNTDGSYSQAHMVFSHRNKTYALRYSVSYDQNGNVTDTYNPNTSIYNPVVPDTMADVIYCSIWIN